jgi:hypothetical protein
MMPASGGTGYNFPHREKLDQGRGCEGSDIAQP